MTPKRAPRFDWNEGISNTGHVISRNCRLISSKAISNQWLAITSTTLKQVRRNAALGRSCRCGGRSTDWPWKTNRVRTFNFDQTGCSCVCPISQPSCSVIRDWCAVGLFFLYINFFLAHKMWNIRNSNQEMQYLWKLLKNKINKAIDISVEIFEDSSKSGPVETPELISGMCF